MAWMHKIMEVIKCLKETIKIKTQLTESGDVNFLQINIGNRYEYPTLPDNFNAERLKTVEFTPEQETEIAEKVFKLIKAQEYEIASLSEMEQLEVMTNAASTTVEAMFLKDRVKTTDELKIEFRRDRIKKYSIFLYNLAVIPLSENYIPDRPARIERVDTLEEARMIAEENKYKADRDRIHPTGDSEKTIEEYIKGVKYVDGKRVRD